MKENNKIAIFEQKRIRRERNEEQQDWLFSIVDICEVLAETDRPRKYWSDLKKKLTSEGSELSEKIGQLKMEGSELCENIGQLKMKASDGKYYLTDVANSEQLLRIIQSIPSKKAEPFKMWLAKVGSERLDEIADPELAIDRAFETYLKKGYSEKWINQRIKSMEVRKEYTNELQARGVTEKADFAILTDEMTQAWSGKSVRAYKRFKGLHKESLRDNMTNAELILNMLAEVTATDITKNDNPQSMAEHKSVARRGGGVAKSARLQYEKETGKELVSSLNALNIGKLEEVNE